MPQSPLENLIFLTLSAVDLAQLSLSSGSLELRRAWPRSGHRLGLEYITCDNETIAGQWFGEAEQLVRVANATAKVAATDRSQITVLPEQSVLLQSGGADRKLSSLVTLMARSGATLLVHKPERRAVVRLDESAGLQFAKVVLKEQVRRLVDTGLAVWHLSGQTFLAPKLIEMNSAAGVVTWSALPGRSFTEWLKAPTDDSPGQSQSTANGFSSDDLGLPSTLSHTQTYAVSLEVGRSLRSLHDSVPPPGIREHSPADEANVLLKWLDRLRLFGLDRCGQSRVANQVLSGLGSNPTRHVLLHRDFYDKQVLIDGNGKVGMLDFDTLAAGEAALDLANMLVHLELRVLQGHCFAETAEIAADALFEGYRPNKQVRRRLCAYADASRLRLACVYAFRPRQASVVRQLMAQLGKPVLNLTART